MVKMATMVKTRNKEGQSGEGREGDGDEKIRNEIGV